MLWHGRLMAPALLLQEPTTQCRCGTKRAEELFVPTVIMALQSMPCRGRPTVGTSPLAHRITQCRCGPQLPEGVFTPITVMALQSMPCRGRLTVGTSPLAHRITQCRYVKQL